MDCPREHDALQALRIAVDCVIRGGALDDSTLIARRICELDYVTCASPGYLASRGIPTHPACSRPATTS